MNDLFVTVETVTRKVYVNVDKLCDLLYGTDEEAEKKANEIYERCYKIK